MVGNNASAVPLERQLARCEEFIAQDARELDIANAELRHVVNLLAACREENAALRAELAAANDAVLELLHDLDGGAA